MIEESPICPYTGLRSFSEDEALYFKGRENQVDQISRLLERNKFLMVTGASGEGKSSLIFAGLIPNARAGFFKAKFNNWVVAGFRPERKPVKNLADAVANALGSRSSTVETELQRGFASLIDLYKASELYVDEHSEEWKRSSDDDRKKRRRSSANLLVLVDQFEEFFTNPENFHSGTPSQDSQVVVNVLLETARIALNEGLPVYVVCTMRSDYIGQCAAFRGLPEYIGFSQFFVPRLKRKEIKQVIEEPAELSGNRISQRLVERLVYDLAEGIDQLPILQHALSQIWIAANDGREEMDLVHYAMVGGMPVSELPDDDQVRFNRWRENLPVSEQKQLQQTGLDRVIEFHADRLYENAWIGYNSAHPEQPVTQRDAKNIIALAFACLTRIDNSRAVRNRMTLKEITEIINRSELSLAVVQGVLDVFREESNSFIRPFKTASAAPVSADTALDITHESLIRNWGRLNKWVNQEYEFHATFLDFKKQLDRWKENHKSRNYLLPIGPLTFFESWYARCKPNAHWIRRYMAEGEDSDLRRQCEQIIRDTQEYLRRSARQVLVSRAFMKYGINRITVITAMIVMVGLSAFYWFDANRKKNKNVIASIMSDSPRLLNSPESRFWSIGGYLVVQDRFKPGSAVEFLEKVEDPYQQLQLAIEVYRQTLILARSMRWPGQDQIRSFIDRHIAAFDSSDAELDRRLKITNTYQFLLAYENYYRPEVTTNELLKTNSQRLHPLLTEAFSGLSGFVSGIPTETSMAVNLWLTWASPKQDEVVGLAKMITPWDSPKAREVFDKYYSKGTYKVVYEATTDYGGGYHVLGSLYAAAGSYENLKRCVGELSSNPGYLRSPITFNAFTNLLGFLYQYHHEDLVPDLLKYAAATSDTPVEDFYTRLFSETGYLQFFFGVNVVDGLNQSYHGDYFPNLDFLDSAAVDRIAEDTRRSLESVKDPAEREFRLALFSKQRAIYDHKYHFDRGLPQPANRQEELLRESWEHFKRTPASYLNEGVKVLHRYYSDGIRRRQMTRKEQYIYPDHIGGAWKNNNYHSDLFFNFLMRQHDVANLYSKPGELGLLHYWVSNAFEVFPFLNRSTIKSDYQLPDSVLERALKFTSTHPLHGEFDPNLVHLVLANRFLQRGDTVSGFKQYHEINWATIYGSANTYEYLNKTFFLNQMKELAESMTTYGHFREAEEICEKFESREQTMLGYVFVARRAYERDFDPRTFIALDSVVTKIKRPGSHPNFDLDLHLLYLLGRIGGERFESRAQGLLKEIDQDLKVPAYGMFSRGLAADANFYRAIESLPSSFTDTQELEWRTLILFEACRQRDLAAGETKWLPMDKGLIHDMEYIFFETN